MPHTGHASYVPKHILFPELINVFLHVFVHKSIRTAAQTMINMSHPVKRPAHYIKWFKTLEIVIVQSVTM